MHEPSQVAVVGAGMMGHGIAVHCALAGATVTLTDQDPKRLAHAREWITSDFQLLVDNGLASPESVANAPKRLTYLEDLSETIKRAHIVFEAVFEDLPVKQEVFKELEVHAPPETLFATTTSSLRVEEIASTVADPGRVIGAHWTNPPHIAPLVEVVLGPKTSSQTHQTLLSFLKQIGKAPVTLRDVTGYIVNRLQYAMLNEAISLVERGITTPEDVDEAVRHGFGIRLACKGPFEWNDLLHDVDITLRIFENLYAAEGDPKFKPSKWLLERVEKGELGLSTGKGWRDYSWRSREEHIRDRDMTLMRMIRTLRELGIVSSIPQRIDTGLSEKA